VDEPFVITVEESTEQLSEEIIEGSITEEEEKIVHDLSEEDRVSQDEVLDPVAEAPISWEISETIVPEALSESQQDLFSEDEPLVKHQLDEDDVLDVKTSPEDHQKITQDRVSKIQEHTSRLKNAEGIADYENEPAFKRRSLFLDNSKPSEQKPSRFGLSEDEDGGSDLSDNSFLHDNVD
jgi:cell division protein FtsZ